MIGQDLGRRVAQVRIRRSLTQEQLAERAEISKVTVSQLEQGLLDGVRLTTLCGLADALEVTVTSLFEAEAEDDVEEQDPVLLLPLRRLLVAQMSTPVSEEDLTLAKLRQRVLDCTEDFDHTRYAKVVTEIPTVVAAIEAAIGLAENKPKADMYRLLGHAYILTAQTLIHLRSEDLACHAVKHAMDAAENAGDSLLRASAAYNYSWAFRRQKMFDDAERVAVTMAAEIEPPMSKATREHLAVWGRLLRAAARAAAYNNRSDAARDLLSLAHMAAVRMDTRRMDYGKYWTEFNTAIVGITRAEIASLEGDAPLALRIGQDLRRTQDTHLDTWAWHLQLRANAQTATRDYGGAISTMGSIRQIAPEWVKNDRVAHEAVIRLLDTTTVRRARSTGLAELAAFMDVKP